MTCVPASEYEKELPGQIPDKLMEKVFVCCNDALEEHDGPVIHALHSKMPECSLKQEMTMPWQIERGDVCRVYCAQSSCSAALDMLGERVDDFERCDKILYMHEGSREMEPSVLRDGEACHNKIDEYNAANFI